RERRRAAGPRRCLRYRAPRGGASGGCGTRGSRPSPSRAALRRRAAARRARARDGARSTAALGRRADGQSGLRDRRGHHRPALRAQSRSWHDAAAGDARRHAGRARRPRGVVARRPHRGRAPSRPGARSVSAARRLAWRQARGAWRHFVLLAACVALGVGALVGVGSFAATLDHTLAREAKALTGGDLELRAARPLDGETAAALTDLRANGAEVVIVRELVAMARAANGRALLVELKAPDAGYPLYGRMQTTPDRPLPSLLADGGTVVHKETLERLGLRVGDSLTLGAATFTVRGVVDRGPDRSAGFVTLGPRVFIAADAVERTGLVQVGSRVRYRALVRLPDALAARAAREAVARRIADPSVRVASYDEAQPGLRRFFTQLAGYLGLVGLASLLVGGIGVASSVATFVRRQAPTIAILKALGADSRTLLATFLWQTLSVGVIASLVGA